MRSNTSLLGKILMGIALRLEILTKILRIIFSQNLSVYSVCSVDPCTLCGPWIRVLCVFRGSVYSVFSVDPCTLCAPWIRKGRKSSRRKMK